MYEFFVFAYLKKVKLKGPFLGSDYLQKERTKENISKCNKAIARYF